MPKKYSLKTLPKPQESKITFKILPTKKVVSLTFSGRWSDKNFNEQISRLQDFATKQNLKTKGSPIINYYDDPFTFPWNRRNEVALEIDASDHHSKSKK